MDRRHDCDRFQRQSEVQAGVVLNFKEGRPVLGSLYAIALVEMTICLPLITAKLGLNLL